MMGSTHHYAHFICRLLVLRIVGIESPAPHGWPHHVAPETQHQFENALVEAVVAILGAVGILHPRGEARRLIVEEDATIAYGWFAIGIDSLVYEDGVVMLHGHVCPVIPRRYAHLLGEFVDAIDGASAVAAGDDELVVHHSDDEFLALALEQISVDAFLFDELVDGSRMSDGSHEDGCLPVGGDGGLGAAHLADVPDQCIGSIAHATAVVGVHIDFYLVITVDEQIALLETDESLCCTHAHG